MGTDTSDGASTCDVPGFDAPGQIALLPSSRDFFEHPPVEVAPRLLGCFIGYCGVWLRITETEAYHGSQDPGSHGFRRRTARNDALFGPPGTVYVYINYGIHRALNIVCGEDGEAAGCLVRSGEIVAGVEIARQRRTLPERAPPKDDVLARGPGNLAKAMGVDLHLSGAPLVGEEAPLKVWLPAAFRQDLYRSGPRVGVSGPGGSGVAFPWRFWIPDDPTVSPYRAAKPRRGTSPETR